MHRLLGQAVALNGKVYIRGANWATSIVLEYTPSIDQWTMVPHPPVEYFTIATLRDQLLIVGGKNKSMYKKTNTILTFDEHSQQWVQSYPAMPTALVHPAVIGYQDHLIVAGGENAEYKAIADVNILDVAIKKWNRSEPLPNTGIYLTVIYNKTMYLVGQDTQTFLRAHVPTLISGANKSGVWETLQNTPYYDSRPITIGNTLFTVGGRDMSYRHGNPTTSIQMYDPITNQWTKAGDIPEPMCHRVCVIINSELFVLSKIVYASKLILDY